MISDYCGHHIYLSLPFFLLSKIMMNDKPILKYFNKLNTSKDGGEERTLTRAAAELLKSAKDGWVSARNRHISI